MAVITTEAKPFVDLAAIGGAIGGALKKGLLAWQVARMRSVLGQFTDAQLDHIGIARKDIPAHARKLILDEA